MDAASPIFKDGDRVDWAGRPTSGAYSFGQPEPAVVRRLGERRVQIEVRRKAPYSKSSIWIAEFKWVPVESLRARHFPTEAFNEPMEMRVGEFIVNGWRHPFGATSQFRRGIWYGAVDGYECTAPCHSEEDAVRCAHHAVLEGGYRAAVLSAIEVREHWAATDQDKEGKGAAELPELRQRLAKVAASAGLIEQIRREVLGQCVVQPVALQT